MAPHLTAQEDAVSGDRVRGLGRAGSFEGDQLFWSSANDIPVSPAIYSRYSTNGNLGSETTEIRHFLGVLVMPWGQYRRVFSLDSRYYGNYAQETRSPQTASRTTLSNSAETTRPRRVISVCAKYRICVLALSAAAHSPGKIIIAPTLKEHCRASLLAHI